VYLIVTDAQFYKEIHCWLDKIYIILSSNTNHSNNEKQVKVPGHNFSNKSCSVLYGSVSVDLNW
jgi:hypothetical protein